MLSRGMKSDDYMQSLEATQRTEMKERVLDHLGDNLAEWYRQHKDDPLWFG